MSLEIALQENTNAIRALIAALGTKPLDMPENPKVWVDQPVGKPAATPTATAPAPAAAAPSAPAAASPSSAAPDIDFDTIKKAFLKLSTTDGGRAKCEAVLKPHGLAKLSEAKPEQYAEILANIQKAGA